MSKTLLVLGGSGFVGRALVLEGLSRGWTVTLFNRGRTEPTPSGVHLVRGDRLDPESLAPLSEHAWDLVLDTWAGAPRAVRDSAVLLSDRAARYAYISSESVYAPPPPLGADETAPTVTAEPDAEEGSYPELKRGAELALEATFGPRALLARAGLILGPYENVGRLTWWLARFARGGEILCPGPRELELQYIDARDLARFVIEASEDAHSGPFNVVSRRGHATIGSLLEACRAVAGGPGAALQWVDPEAIAAAGIEPWTELPIWLPPGHEYAGMHDADVERAHAAGLRCRPVTDTVLDTWRWMSELGAPPPVRAGLPVVGLDAERERAALDAWRTHW